MKPVRLVLFDFDGTISDSHDAAIETYNSISEKFGLRPIQTQNLAELKDVSTREALKKLGISLFKLPFVVREVRIRFQERIESLQPFEGILDALLELKKSDFRLGILTSNSKRNVTDFLLANHIDCFDVVYSGASVFGKSKIIQAALRKDQLSPEEVVYVGDETRDIDAGKSVGVRVVSVCWGFNSREVLGRLNSDYLIDTPCQLPAVIRNM